MAHGVHQTLGAVAELLKLKHSRWAADNETYNTEQSLHCYSHILTTNKHKMSGDHFTSETVPILCFSIELQVPKTYLTNLGS